MAPAHLLFVLSDQHNRDTLGCYGHPTIQTPHLDALAARGVRFDAAYTNCPICVPARASLATGEYVHRIGYWDNAFPYDGRVRGWGHRLQEAGHRVDSIGKLHYRSVQDDDGFSDRIVPLNVVDGVGDVMGAIRDDPPIRSGMRGGVTEAGPGTSTYIDYDIEIADRSIEWLRNRSAEPDAPPWMLFCSFVCPHPPFIAPPDLFELYPPEDIPLPVQNRRDEQPRHPALETLRRTMHYDGPFSEDQIRKVTAAYYGTCTHLDRQVGRVLEVLEQTGLAESTRIIYTSDHGESMGRRGLWGKFTLYEESAAVPLILAGPDVPVGQSTRDPVTLVDCHPTLLEAVGVAPDAPALLLAPAVVRGPAHAEVALDAVGRLVVDAHPHARVLRVRARVAVPRVGVDVARPAALDVLVEELVQALGGRDAVRAPVAVAPVARVVAAEELRRVVVVPAARLVVRAPRGPAHLGLLRVARAGRHEDRRVPRALRGHAQVAVGPVDG